VIGFHFYLLQADIVPAAGGGWGAKGAGAQTTETEPAEGVARQMYGPVRKRLLRSFSCVGRPVSE